MSSSRHHIPFPTNYLSLNTPSKKTSNASPLSSSPESERAAHSFLSNRPVAGPRHASISSVNSIDSPTSPASSPPASELAASPVLKAAIPAFLTLNTKYAVPPTTAKEMRDKSGFLSNRV